MKFGHFDDGAKEYVIDTPATPLPWINYLGNDGFFSLISNTAGGYCFYKDAKLRRITRFRYNNVPADIGGRMYYIKDGDVTFSPAFLPAKTELDSYKCRHGLGYTVIEGVKNKISSTLTCLVPLEKNCEINKLTVKNTGDKAKTISIYSAREWCLWNAVDDASNFQRNFNIGEVEVENNVMYHKTEYRERRDHYSFFASNTDMDGFDTDRDTFIGHFGDFSSPQMVGKGQSGNSMASGWAPIACNRIDVTLEPSEEKTIIYTLGYVENEEDEKFQAPNVINKKKALELISEFDTEEKFDKAMANLSKYWEEILGRYKVDSDDKVLDRMVNIWNQYQCMVTFNMSRSASYFESGMGRGMGFRDSCQDILGFVHLVPTRARARIIDIASIQFEDGSTYHQYQPLTKTGNGDVGSGFNDDPLWLVACTAAYIKETGDASILDEMVPFNNVEGSEKTLFAHLRQSVMYTYNNRGEHGLPLIGRADWNDCLNLNCFSVIPGESFQTCDNFDSKKAESVFIAGMFVKYGEEYAEICNRYGDKKEAENILSYVGDMKEAVITHGYDKDWFLRAYDAFGNKVGSDECEEGKIYIEPQGFCTMAGIGLENGYAQRAMDSVEKYLVNDYGAELLSPCYTTYKKELGEISSYPPGYKENGSVFAHNNPWISIAEVKLGNKDKAYDHYMRLSPAFNEKVSEIRRTEPYVYSQTVAGRDAQNYGEAKNSWLTGTAAWSFVNASQSILGIIPDFEGLRIEPCVPSSIGKYTVNRMYRDSMYSITVNNNSGKKCLIVDGETIDGSLIIPNPKKESYKVEVYI